MESPLPLPSRIGRGSVGIVVCLLTTAALPPCPCPLVFCLTITGLAIGLESQPPAIYPPLVASFPKHYGWSLDDPAVRFFAGHVEADTVHSARGFKIAEKYCDTPELKDEG